MTEAQANDNAYLVQSVDIISEADQVAFVMTEAGGYVVEAIPEVGTDARQADIMFVATTLAEAIEKYENIYG